MKVKTNVSTILVSEENRYVSLGLNIPDIEEIQIFDVNFIKNTHNWGITVVDPDGKTTTKLTKICKSSLEVEIFFDEYDFEMLVYYDNDSHTYEILFLVLGISWKAGVAKDFYSNSFVFSVVKSCFIFIRYYNCLTY